MTFTSRTAESYDLAPYRAVKGGARAGANVAEGMRRIGVEVIYDPRPEFEPATDSIPWLVSDGIDSWRCSTAWRNSYTEHGAKVTSLTFTWAPRDRHRNAILVTFRAYGEVASRNPLHWLEGAVRWGEYTPVEIDHARRVLTLLATLTTHEKENHNA